jgi:hypothetical protein
MTVNLWGAGSDARPFAFGGSHASDWLTSNFRSFRTGFCALDEAPEATQEALQGFP